MFTLTTPRLLLRDFAPADLDAVHAYGADPEVSRFMEWGPNTLDQTQAFLTGVVEAATARPRTLFELAVVERSASNGSGQLVGGVGLRLEDQGRQAMLGYCFARPAWGRGLATEAATALVAWGFAEMGLHRIWARCDTENTASLGVLSKLGLRSEGTLRQDCRIRGQWRDTHVLALLREEWTENRPATGG